MNYQAWYQCQLRLIQTMCAEQPIAFVALTSGVREKLYINFHIPVEIIRLEDGLLGATSVASLLWTQILPA